ncbi:MAG: helix-turn-helix transcriptional regulator [Synergistaceae bacterium]|nr:helix-turn-helix transcriptional regulator [Synergistaceae bacterium]
MNTPNYVYSNLDGMFRDRMLRGLSLYDVASQCDVSVRALKDYETRRTSPKQGMYNRLAGVFGWEAWI